MSVAQPFKTPAGRARGLGSAKEGVGHYIKQRVSAIALIFLIPWFLFAIMNAVDAGYAGARDWAGKPWNAILLVLTFGAAFFHMRLGMQTVIEDYIGRTGTKQALLILNTFAAIALFAVSALTVLKIWFTAGA
ncbi:MAG: succinate dehydrogenase, hydrophobic membrane anchor protein [Pseudomonadota bacterium]